MQIHFISCKSKHSDIELPLLIEHGSLYVFLDYPLQIMWLSGQVLIHLFKAVEYLDTFALVHVRGLQEPEVLLHVLRGHTLVKVKASLYLLKLLLELVILQIVWVASDYVSKRQCVLDPVLILHCLLRLC